MIVTTGEAVLLFGLLANAFAIMWGMWRMTHKVAAVSIQIDGLLLERDKKNVDEGEKKGRQEATEVAVVIAKNLAEGQRQGREESERSNKESIELERSRAGPVSVEDERTAMAAERIADAAESSVVVNVKKKKP